MTLLDKVYLYNQTYMKSALHRELVTNIGHKKFKCMPSQELRIGADHELWASLLFVFTQFPFLLSCHLLLKWNPTVIIFLDICIWASRKGRRSSWWNMWYQWKVRTDLILVHILSAKRNTSIKSISLKSSGRFVDSTIVLAKLKDTE